MSCPKCGGFRIDISGMTPSCIEQMKECVAYHVKHSKFCDPEVARRVYGD